MNDAATPDHPPDDRARWVLDRIVETAETDRFGAHAVHVLIGDDQAEHLWSPDVARDVHSVAKAVCVLAAGLAVDAGLFDLDAPVAAHFPDWRVGSGTEHVTTRHLLSMRSGIDHPWSPTWLTDWPDVAQEFLSRPSAGRVFQYSPASTYTAMRALSTAVGDVGAWLSTRLFAPLDIDPPHWERCPGGWVSAAGGLWLRSSELARVGRLIRDDGCWRDERVLSSAWTEAMRTEWHRHDAPENYDRYSLGAWGGPSSGWRLHGAHGQLVIFRDDAVVTLTADDHLGADLMAEWVVEVLEQAAPDQRPGDPRR